MFFYNRETRAAATGKLGAAGNYHSLVEFPAGQFGEWTHIVSVEDRLFFYNRETTAAATGKLDAAGNYHNQADFPAGQFGEWTHIVDAE